MIRFKLPEKVSTNAIYAGMHWAKRKRIADHYHLAVLEEVSKLEKQIEYPVDITYVFNFKGNPLDTTNCTFMVKMIEDGLVQAGLLADDDPTHIQCTTIYSQKGPTDFVEVTIT